MNNKKRSINYILLSGFIITCALMPFKSFGLKQLFWGLLVFLNAGIIIESFIKYKYILIFGLILPAWLFFDSVVAGGSVSDSIRAIYIFSFIWIPPIAMKYRVDLKRVFINVTFIMAILIDLFVVLHATGIIPLQSNFLAMWLHDSGNAQMSYGSVAIFYYVFYLNACPLMLFTLIDALKTEKAIRTTIVLMALMFSGTRANIYLGFLTVISYFVVFKRNDWKKFVMIMIGGVVALYSIVRLAPRFVEKVQIINSVKNSGDSIRDNRTLAAINEILGNAKVFLVGMGANVPFKANGVLNYSSEMSYIEIWRIFGIFSLVGIVSMLLFILWKNRRNAEIIAYMAYLAICAVDPFLMTSTGFLMIMYMFYLFMKKEQSTKLSEAVLLDLCNSELLN